MSEPSLLEKLRDPITHSDNELDLKKAPDRRKLQLQYANLTAEAAKRDGLVGYLR
jgi:hypothetical protein